jgi:hypothetical protein
MARADSCIKGSRRLSALALDAEAQNNRSATAAFHIGHVNKYRLRRLVVKQSRIAAFPPARVRPIAPKG